MQSRSRYEDMSWPELIQHSLSNASERESILVEALRRMHETSGLLSRRIIFLNWVLVFLSLVLCVLTGVLVMIDMRHASPLQHPSVPVSSRDTRR